ncbi:MAG: hypothetical protein ACYDBJ_22395 [Aggregatilineales bacterium]
MTILKDLTTNWIARGIAAIATLSFAMLALAACNGQPTLIVMQVTNTPDPRVIEITVTNTGNAPVAASNIPTSASNLPTQAAVVPTIGALFTPSASVPPVTISSAPTQLATTVPATAVPSVAVPAVVPSQAIGPTATPNPAPTDTRTQMYIAQEDFQHGFMFWISSVTQIWVLLPSSDTAVDQAPTHGQWQIFQDTYQNSEPETDPAFAPPANLYQPRRGFGKLWRSNTTIRGGLGWGTTPEFGLTTSYVYQPGGYVNATTGQWVAGPGTHFLVTLSRETFAFHEPQPGQQYGTWEKVG